MNIIIFGGTAGTGHELASQALEQGHTVTVFARDPTKLTLKHDNIHIVKGDAVNYTAVEQALINDGKRYDAVLCALGSPAMDKTKLRANATHNIVKAMQKNNINRLICLSGHGANDSHETLPFHYKYLIVPLLLRHVYADHNIQEQHIKHSNLDWVIVRPAALVNKTKTGQYWHGTVTSDMPLSLKIARADVAHFMLMQLSDDQYLRKTPSLSYLKSSASKTSSQHVSG